MKRTLIAVVEVDDGDLTPIGYIECVKWLKDRINGEHMLKTIHNYHPVMYKVHGIVDLEEL